MSSLLGVVWLSRAAYDDFLVGFVLGALPGALIGQWLTWLTLRNPLGWLIRVYADLYRDIGRLCRTGRLT